MARRSQRPNDKTVFNFKLVYFNTASSKLLLDILLILEEIYEEQRRTSPLAFPDDDEDMEEAGEEYADIVEIPFEQVSYSMD